MHVDVVSSASTARLLTRLQALAVPARPKSAMAAILLNMFGWACMLRQSKLLGVEGFVCVWKIRVCAGVQGCTFK